MDENVQRTRRLSLSPTCTYLFLPDVEISNRVLRKYPDRKDYFVRASFVTEKIERGFYFTAMQAPLTEWIKEVMNSGIRIGTQEFKFMCYSNSQIKNHAFWMMNEEPGWDIPSLFKELGKFSEEKKPSKNASRKGQCFSTTFKVLTLSKD